MAATTGSIFVSSAQISSAARSTSITNPIPSVSNAYGSCFKGVLLRENYAKRSSSFKSSGTISAAAATAVVTAPSEEIKEFVLPKWADFDIGRSPIYWKTMNGRPPTAGQKLRIFYNPAANNLVPNEEFGIAFNGGFNQPIMCGGEPRAMLLKNRGTADGPIYSIQICIPKHALNLIFSFTNGSEWDGPYRLQFQVPKAWRNKPIDFFNEGLTEELSQDGACEQAIFPDTNIVVSRCSMNIGNLNAEGGDRCDLDLVTGCTDPSSPLYDPLANVDDGSCPLNTDSDDEQ